MEKEIGRIRKNDTTEVVLRMDDFGGKRGLTIREFVTGDQYTGFTKSGVRIPVGDISKFKEMINSIGQEDMEESNQGEENKEPQKKQKTLKSNFSEEGYL